MAAKRKPRSAKRLGKEIIADLKRLIRDIESGREVLPPKKRKAVKRGK